MESILPAASDSAPVAPPTHRWLSLSELKPGMVLARPVTATQHGVLAFRLPEGNTLTENTIAQFFSRGVESVAVCDPEPMSAEEYARLAAAHRERLQVIFGVDDPLRLDPARQALFQALLKVGPHR